MSIVENSLQGVRLEWVVESTQGEFPTDPSWNKFSDYLDEITPFSPGLNTAENEVVGSGQIRDITRGAEETSTLTVNYWLQRSLVDGSGNAQDPAAIPFLHDYGSEYESHTVVYRSDRSFGGADSNGVRRFTVASGAKPVSATIPGDPGEDSPQSIEVQYECEKIRTYAVDQPSSTTLSVESTDSAADDGNVTVSIEDEGASTTESIDSGSSGANTFDGIDAAEITSGTPQGDISITDGSGTTYLTLDGETTNGIDYDEGIPTLGSGSHASDIGNDPEQFLFLNTTSAYSSSAIADRIHQFDLTAEINTDTNAQQGTRRPTIDIGTLVVEADVDIAEDNGSVNQIREFLRGTTGDLELALGDTSTSSAPTLITVESAQLTDVDDQQYSPGDANNIYGATFTAQDEDEDGAVVTMTDNS